MHQHGSIVRWDAARGFGFIRSARTQADVFFHIRDFRGTPDPALRMAVEYEEIHVGGKGPRAMAVRPREAAQTAGSPGSGHPKFGDTGSHTGTRTTLRAAAQRPAQRHRTLRAATPSPAPATDTALLQLLVVGWLALLAWGLWIARLPLWMAGVLLGVNLLTMWTYAADKNAARARTWRVSENQLHLLSLLGGWPAAWLAQQNLRHKTRKASFRAVYWLTIALHCGAMGLWVWRGPTSLSF